MRSKWEDVRSKFNLIEGWCREGLLEKQIANNLGVSVSTFEEYKKKHPELSELLRRNKEVADFEVENALFKRCTGFDVVEETWEEGVLTKKVKKHVAPDPTAIIFWLKNRKPAQWRDKRNVDVGNTNDEPFRFNNLSTDQIKKMLKKESDED